MSLESSCEKLTSAFDVRWLAQVFRVIAQQLRGRRRLFGHVLRRPSDLFAIIDRDGSDGLDAPELRDALRRMDIGLTAAQVEEVLTAVDADGNETIELGEFVARLEGEWGVPSPEQRAAPPPPEPEPEPEPEPKPEAKPEPAEPEAKPKAELTAAEPVLLPEPAADDWLDNYGLRSVQQQLEALGVEAENDLQYLTKDEIDGLELKPVTARKLRAAIATAAHYAG